MKRLTEILSGSAAVLFQVALTGWMFSLSEINFEFVSMELNYIYLSLLMLAAYLLNMFMMRRGVPVPVFAAVQLVILALAVFTFVNSVSIEPYRLRTVIINCVIYCIGFAVAAFVAWTPTNQSGILLRFDALTIMIVLSLVLEHVLGLCGASDSLAMCYFSICLCILASISLKAGALSGRGGAVQGSPALGRIMLGIAFGVVAAAAALIVVFASSGVKSFSQFLLNILTVCVGAVKAALKFLYSLLERFIQWLAQFIKESPAVPPDMEPAVGMDIPVGSETAVALPEWIYYALAAVAAAAVVYIIFRLRKFRTGKIQVRTVAITAVKRENGLKEALLELWRKFCGELLFRYNCLRYRRSCAGLLAWCERRAEGELCRRPDESGERYLLRIASILGGESGALLSELANMVEKSFYSPRGVSISNEFYRKVRRIKFKTEKNTEAAV